MMYVAAGESCMDFTWHKGRDGLDILYSPRPKTDEKRQQRPVRRDRRGGRKQAWDARFRAPFVSAALATGGGVVFGGGRDRMFRAFDSRTGEELWHVQLDNVPAAAPISFARDGKQYVAITTGGGHANDVTRSSQTPEIELAPAGTTLWLFRLPEE